MKNIWILFVLLPLVYACNSNSNAREINTEIENVVVFKNVNLISMENPRAIPGQTVVVRGSTIQSISGDASYDESAEIIDGTGKYLMPGLAEMHAHIPTSDQGELVEETLFLYLAGGVTTIRGMLGHPSHLELRKAVSEGSVLGPNIYTSGPSFNGNSTPDAATAQRMVREQKSAGYDFLKLHPGLKLEVFDALVSTAGEVGISFAGHVSIEVGIRHALDSKYASIDHLDGYLEGLVPSEAAVDPAANGFFGLNFTDLADESMLPDLIKSTIQNEVWVVPTQCLAERWSGPVETVKLQAEPEMRYMPRQTLNNWVESKNQMLSNVAYDPGKAQRFIDLRRRMIKAMYDAGVGILLGSDAPQVFNVPGFAIQHEIEMYVGAGLTPYQAMLTGTVNPARFFNNDQRLGMVKEGYQADLLLVDGNPLDDITNLRKKAGVMIKGQWLPKDKIEARLKALAAKYQGQ